MSAGKLEPGATASFPLPVSGQPGAQFQRNMKMHPAAMTAAASPSRQNPLNGGRPAMAGHK